nr:hypothetical protein [Tanacetum cinerariifolium]
AHPNPQPGNMNGWVDYDDDVEAEEADDEPEAEVADVELEAEEPDDMRGLGRLSRRLVGLRWPC